MPVPLLKAPCPCRKAAADAKKAAEEQAAAEAKKAAEEKAAAQAKAQREATEAKKVREAERANKAAEAKATAAAAELEAAAETERAAEAKKAAEAQTAAAAGERTATKEVCETCRGSGRAWLRQCDACVGTGHLREAPSSEPKILITSVFCGDEGKDHCRKKREKKTMKAGPRPIEQQGSIAEDVESKSDDVADETLFEEFVHEVSQRGDILMNDSVGLGTALRKEGWHPGRIERFQKWRVRRQREMEEQFDERRRRKQAEQDEEDERFLRSIETCSSEILESTLQVEEQYAYPGQDESLRSRAAKKELARRAATKQDDGEPVQLLGIGLADADEAAGAQGAMRRR